MTVADAVEQFLATVPAADAFQVCRALKITPKAASVRLSRLHGAGRIARVACGVYSVRVRAYRQGIP